MHSDVFGIMGSPASSEQIKGGEVIGGSVCILPNTNGQTNILKERRFNMAKKITIIFLSILISLPLFIWPITASAAQSGENWPKAIAIAAGRPGGGVYTIATGMASIMKKYMNVSAHAESGLFGKNIVLLHNGDVEFGMGTADLTYDAGRGLGSYKKFGNMKLRLLFSGSTSPAAFIVRRDSGIKAPADLKKKTVMATMPANMTFTRCGDMILKSAGMSRKDVKDMTFAGPKAGREALAARRVDAFISLFPSMGRTAWAEELNLTTPIRLISGEEKALEGILDEVAFARKAKFYAEYYGEMIGNKDMMSVGIPHTFLSRRDLSEDLVYETMKVFFNHLEELYAFHLEAKAYLANPLDLAVIPYHPGAVKYYKEKGKWSPALEKTQQKLLKEVDATN